MTRGLGYRTGSRRCSISTNFWDATNWRGIAGFRNVLVHGYLGVNVVRVWEIVERDLAVIEKLVLAILQEHGMPHEEKH